LKSRTRTRTRTRTISSGVRTTSGKPHAKAAKVAKRKVVPDLCVLCGLCVRPWSRADREIGALPKRWGSSRCDDRAAFSGATGVRETPAERGRDAAARRPPPSSAPPLPLTSNFPSRRLCVLWLNRKPALRLRRCRKRG
jgi:hypothetical protein